MFASTSAKAASRRRLGIVAQSGFLSPPFTFGHAFSTKSSVRFGSTDSSSPSSSTSSPRQETTSSSSSSSSSSFPRHTNELHGLSSYQRFRQGIPRPGIFFYLGWLPVAAFITSHVYSLGNVTGGSMSPTINGPFETASAANARADLVLLNRKVTWEHEYKPGDIVTLISPLDPNMLLTKRIIALPGDTVRVWVPAGSASRSSGRNPSDNPRGRWSRMKIPPGHVWVEGDAAVDFVPGDMEKAAYPSASNRTAQSYRSSGSTAKNKSRDSREFGPIPVGLITSRIDYILWPPERFGKPGPRPDLATQRKSGRTTKYPPSSTTDDPITIQDPQGDSLANGLKKQAAIQFERDDDEEFHDLATQVNPSLARILDEMTNMAPNLRTKAHPQDSVISPYVDWHGDEKEEDGEAEQSRKGKDLKDVWNRLSRGGRLGDDAD